jgi:hypothetical protein
MPPGPRHAGVTGAGFLHMQYRRGCGTAPRGRADWTTIGPGAAYRVAGPVGVHCSSAPVSAVGTGPERMYAPGTRQGGLRWATWARIPDHQDRSRDHRYSRRAAPARVQDHGHSRRAAGARSPDDRARTLEHGARIPGHRYSRRAARARLQDHGHSRRVAGARNDRARIREGRHRRASRRGRRAAPGAAGVRAWKASSIGIAYASCSSPHPTR